MLMDMPFPRYMESGSSAHTTGRASRIQSPGAAKVRSQQSRKVRLPEELVEGEDCQTYFEGRGFPIDRAGLLVDDRFGAPKTPFAAPGGPQTFRAPSTFSLSQNADSARLAAVFTVSSWRARSRMRAAIARRSSGCSR